MEYCKKMSTNYIFLSVITVFFAFTAKGPSMEGLKEEQGIYRKVHDAPLQLINGRQTTIRQLSAEGPIVLAMIFTRCSGICYPFILQLKEQMAYVEGGRDFQLLVSSFDPNDRITEMKAYAERFNLSNRDDWKFAVTPQIHQLNQSLMFDPVWDSLRQQFEHDALLVGINNEGYITKKLLGLRNHRDLTLLVASIHNEFSPTYRLPGQNQIFSCFNYNPQTGQSTPGFGLLFIALPGILAFMFLLSIRFLVKQH